MELAEKAEQAIAQSAYDDAVKLYTQAIEQAPRAVDYYIGRSVAYTRLKQPADALRDSETAVVLALDRGDRGKRAAAQFRRAIALHQLGKHADAKVCLDLALEADYAGKDAALWKPRIESAAAKDDTEATVTAVPSVAVPKDPSPRQTESDLPPISVPKGDRKPTMEWYQTGDRVTVSFLIRGVDKDKCEVSIGKRSLSVHFPLPGSASGADYAHDIDRLCGEVDVSKSSFRVLGSKVEVSLGKGTPGQKWPKLESSGDEPPLAGTSAAMSTSATDSGPPAYPTSSKTGPKNWDRVVADLSGKGGSGCGDGSDSSGLEGSSSRPSTAGAGAAAAVADDDEGGDAVNNLFKKIYADADDATRRAMIKSYTESGGTSLSTDWSSVGQERQKVQPPQGMEARKW